jgi:hypothetical protein
LLSGQKTAHFIRYFDYLSIPAKAETDDAFDLSTNPGPDGMFAPGRRPAPLLYKWITTTGI